MINNFCSVHFEHVVFLNFLLSLKFRFQQYIILGHIRGSAKIRHYGFAVRGDLKITEMGGPNGGFWPTPLYDPKLIFTNTGMLYTV